MQIVLRENPMSLLDVGCGMGIYGFLCRIYLEQTDLFNFKEKK
jgi:16S rRNA G1207 methylase RsmC